MRALSCGFVYRSPLLVVSCLAFRLLSFRVSYYFACGVCVSVSRCSEAQCLALLCGFVSRFPFDPRSIF